MFKESTESYTTSVPSHQQLLSGSSFSLLALGLLSFFLTACGSTSTNTLRTPTKSPVVKKQKAVEKPTVDTVQWTVVPESEVPPITEETEAGEEIIKKDVYHLSLFLPLDATKKMNTQVESDATLKNFVNFYSGALIGLRQLEQEGVRMNVEVFDSERNCQKIAQDLESFQNEYADVIIGPYDRDCLIETAAYGKENKVAVVSPWQSTTKVSENPYYVQLRPNLSGHFYTMLEHARSEFSEDEIVLMGRNTKRDKSYISGMQNYNREELGGQRLTEFMVEEDSLIHGDSAFDNLFVNSQKRQVFIFPHWSSSDESFLYNCLRKMNVEKGMKDVVVYTMPLAYNSEQIGFGLYRNLKMRIAGSKFVNNKNDQVRAFEKQFFEQTGSFPTSSAYQGHDVVLYIGRAMHKYGINFQYFLDRETDPLLMYSYDVNKKVTGTPEQTQKVNYFVNNKVGIIGFQGRGFITLN